MADLGIVSPKPGLDADWARADPDQAEDFLPQPFRRVNELLEELLDAVNDKIDIILARQRSQEHEPGLPQYSATAEVSVPGLATCAAVDAKGTSLIAIGIQTGAVILVETRGTPAICVQKQAFPDGEGAAHIAMCSEGNLRVPMPVGLDPEQFAEAVVVPRKGTKLVVSGDLTPRIQIYDVLKDTYGCVLHPNCTVAVPAVEGDSPGKSAPVSQLSVVGVDGCMWVIALLPDSSVRAYRVPLVRRMLEEVTIGVGDQVIHEEDEGEEEDEAHAVATDEFKELPQFSTATYHFSLAELASSPGLSEPSLKDLTLTAFAPRADGHAKSSAPVPAYCFTTSSSSGTVVAHCLRCPPPETANLAGGLEAILKDVAPPPGIFSEPEASQELRPCRTLGFASYTSAVASSARSGCFAVGGHQGTLALIAVGCGIHLSTVLPGHYAAVAALVFHGQDALLSLGADGWVHHYDITTASVTSRHLCTPPPDPPPGLAVVAASAYPMAMSVDTMGNMRLIDVKRGQKLARATCFDESGEAHAPGSTKLIGAPPIVPGQKLRILATSGSFCVHAELEGVRSTSVDEGEAEGAGEEEDHGEGEEDIGSAESPGSKVLPEATTLYLFDAAGVPDASPPVLSAAVLPASQDGSPTRAGAVLQDATRLSPQSPMSMAASRSRAISMRSTLIRDAVTSDLTEENLEKIGKSGQSPRLTVTSNLEGAAPDAVGAKNVPLGWDVAVKQRLRAKRIDKNVRHARIGKRLEAIRHHMTEGAGAA